MRDPSNDKLQKAGATAIWAYKSVPYPETCQAALRDIIKHTVQTAVIRWSIDGWQPKSEPGSDGGARTCVSFRDGTGNPKVSTTAKLLTRFCDGCGCQQPSTIRSGEKRQLSGSPPYPLLCRVWDRTPLQEQTDIFGGANTVVRRWDGKKEADQPDFCQRPRGEYHAQRQPYTPGESARSRILKNTGPLPPRFTAIRADSPQADSLMSDWKVFSSAYQANLADRFIFVQNLSTANRWKNTSAPLRRRLFLRLARAWKRRLFGKKGYWAYKSAIWKTPSEPCQTGSGRRFLIWGGQALLTNSNLKIVKRRSRRFCSRCWDPPLLQAYAFDLYLPCLITIELPFTLRSCGWGWRYRRFRCTAPLASSTWAARSAADSVSSPFVGAFRADVIIRRLHRCIRRRIVGHRG